MDGFYLTIFIVACALGPVFTAAAMPAPARMAAAGIAAAMSTGAPTGGGGAQPGPSRLHLAGPAGGGTAWRGLGQGRPQHGAGPDRPPAWGAGPGPASWQRPRPGLARVFISQGFH
jgi:hypothetical protein